MRARKLDRLTYQLLRGSAEKYGGIGGGLWTEDGKPYCVHGHAAAIGPRAVMALDKLGIGTGQNDVAVEAVTRRRWFGLGRFFLYSRARIPFAKWCAELRVVPS